MTGTYTYLARVLGLGKYTPDFDWLAALALVGAYSLNCTESPALGFI